MSDKEHIEKAKLEYRKVYLHGKISGCYQVWLPVGGLSVAEFEDLIKPMKDEIAEINELIKLIYF